MANKGKRMVFEEDIKRIGEGGGTTYTAGDNITISADNVISATDTTYTAGTGISISDENVISADTTVMATKSDTPDLLSDYVTTGGNVYVQEETNPVTGDKTFKIATDPEAYPAVTTLSYVLNDQNIYLDSEDVDTENKTLDISDFINSIPLLQTNDCSDFATLPNPKVYMPSGNPNLIDNPNTNYILNKGLLLMKKTSTNEYIIIDTAGKYSGLQVVPTGTSPRTVNNNQGYAKVFRSGSND